MLFTHDDLKAELENVIRREGGISQAAKTLRVSRSAIHNIINGTFSIGENVASALGYRPVTRYERIHDEPPSRLHFDPRGTDA